MERYFTAPACTATRTATPTKNSRHWRYAANAKPRNWARGGRLRTASNPVKRFPYALFARNLRPPSWLKRLYKQLEVFRFLGPGPIDSNSIAKPYLLPTSRPRHSSYLL